MSSIMSESDPPLIATKGLFASPNMSFVFPMYSAIRFKLSAFSNAFSSILLSLVLSDMMYNMLYQIDKLSQYIGSMKEMKQLNE